MVPNLLFYQLLLVALVLICLLIHVWWPDPSRAAPPRTLKPDNPRRKRSKEPKPFTGYIHKPLCEACEQGIDTRPQAPGLPPPTLTFSRGRKRTVDPHVTCVPSTIVLTKAGLAAATFAPMGIRVASLGGSCSVCRVRDISMGPTAPFFMANAPRPTSSCTSSPAWPRV